MVERWVSRSPFPAAWDALMSYTENIVLTGGSAGVMGTEFIFAINDLFDPNYSGSGHQPYGFDTLTPVWKRYLVRAAEVEIQFTDPNEDGEFVAVLVQGSQGVYPLTGKDIYVVDENPQVTSKFLNNTGSQQASVKTGLIPFHAVEGITAQDYKAQADQYGALVSTDPSRLIFLRVSLGSISGSSSSVCHALVRIRMHAHFYDRVAQPVS